MKVAVTSRSFSKNLILREKLLEKYPDSYFNEKGQNYTCEELIEFLKSASAAIVGLEKVDHETLQALPQLKTISKYGVGLDNIDFSAMEKHNVHWSYTPGTNRLGVAELALQMMMILIRRSYQANLFMREGSWSPQYGYNLSGKKIGLLGLGHVGKELVKLLAPFECNISYHDIKPDMEFSKKHKLTLVTTEELFSGNDIVSIHIPLNKSNQLLINEKLMSLMPAHSILINTSRGGLVDEKALFEKLKSNKILAAGFDVFLKEPFSDKELLSLPNFYSTPHIGGSSVESVLAMGLAAINGLGCARPINDDDYRL